MFRTLLCSSAIGLFLTKCTNVTADCTFSNKKDIANFWWEELQTILAEIGEDCCSHSDSFHILSENQDEWTDQVDQQDFQETLSNSYCESLTWFCLTFWLIFSIFWDFEYLLSQQTPATTLGQHSHQLTHRPGIWHPIYKPGSPTTEWGAGSLLLPS